MTAGLTIAPRRSGGILVLDLAGRLIFDEDGDTLLRQVVTQAVAGGERRILLNMAGVRQMDSGGVGTLVAVYLHAAKRGGHLKVLSPSERVARVLHMTHLETAFEIFEDEAQAVASFGAIVD